MQSIQVQSNQLEMGLKVISSDKRGFLDLSLNFTSIVGLDHNYEMKLINIFYQEVKLMYMRLKSSIKFIYTLVIVFKKNLFVSDVVNENADEI